MTFWTYMLHCNGGAFYVGHTDDLERRVAQHEIGATPGFVRDHLPVKLVWSEAFSTREEALAMERRLKGGAAPRNWRLSVATGTTSAGCHVAKKRAGLRQAQAERSRGQPFTPSASSILMIAEKSSPPPPPLAKA